MAPDLNDLAFTDKEILDWMEYNPEKAVHAINAAWANCEPNFRESWFAFRRVIVGASVDDRRCIKADVIAKVRETKALLSELLDKLDTEVR